MEAVILKGFAALLLVVDPIALVPMYLALAADHPAKERAGIALQGSVVATCILGIFAITGTALLDHLGISMAAFRVAGGLLLFKIAVDMVFVQRQRRNAEEKADDARRDQPGVFPLGVPIMAGPGAIATVVILRQDLGGSGTGVLLTLACIVSVMLISLGSLLLANRLADRLGRTGINVVTRVLGILLAALAVQFVADGVRALAAI